MANSFVTKDMILNASKEETKNRILSIPQSVTSITLLVDSAVTNTIKLHCDQGSKNYHSIVEIIMSSVNNIETKLTLNSRYADGSTFEKDEYVVNGLNNVQGAIEAAFENNLVNFKPHVVKVDSVQGIFGIITLIAAGIAIFYGAKACSL